MNNKMQDIWKCSATEIAKRVNERQITAVQVVKNGLQRLDEANPALNAVVEYDKYLVARTRQKSSMIASRQASNCHLPVYRSLSKTISGWLGDVSPKVL